MNAADVMTRDVITIGPETTVRSAAALMSEKWISALPVVDHDGRLIGIVSEGDLIRRTETGTEPRRSWWLDLLTFPQRPVADFIKANAIKVGDLMTTDVLTATEGTPLSEIATTLERNRVKRLPIVRNGKVVGIVSRANLVRALASSASVGSGSPARLSDQEIRERVLDHIGSQPFGTPWLVTVAVDDGVVTLWGPTRSELEHRALRIAAESTPGVREVIDNLFPWPLEVV